MPPASSIRSTPAAISQGLRPYSQKPSSYEAVGELRGNVAQFRKQCQHGPVSGCIETFKIEAPAGKPVRVTIDWISPGAQYNSVALLQLKLRPLAGEPPQGPDERPGGP